MHMTTQQAAPAVLQQAEEREQRVLAEWEKLCSGIYNGENSLDGQMRIICKRLGEPVPNLKTETEKLYYLVEKEKKYLQQLRLY